MVLVLLWGWVRGRETRASLMQRMALHQAPAPSAGPRIWVHGASVGELRAAKHLIERLLDNGTHGLIVTANTQTGVQVARSWALDGVSCRRAPADSFGATSRFLTHWHVQALLTLENELWPNRVRACARRAIPAFGVGTRVPGAARTGGIVRRIAVDTLSAYRRIWPQHEAARDELQGLVAAELIGAPYNAKATLPWRPDRVAPPAELAPWAGLDIVLAASTHAPEESLLAQVLAQASEANPSLRMIIAPRHPDRGHRIARSLEKYGMSMACRSENERITADTRLYLADTMGEMDLWYGAAARTIIGGTFAPKGGHTPIEPILADSLVLHGPDTRNHQDSFAALDAAGGAILMADQAALVAALSRPMHADELAAGLAAGRRVVMTLAQEAKLRSNEIADHIYETVNA